MRFVTRVAAFLLLSSSIAFAQGGATSSITGVVKDAAAACCQARPSS